MKKAYFECAKKYGIPWQGRMNNGAWDDKTVYNKCISLCNSYLYGICCSVINTLGYSPALGILHTGSMLSLAFDIADLYKIDFSIPLGFELARDFDNKDYSQEDIEKELRRRALKKFQEEKLLLKILNDMEDLFNDSLHNKKSEVHAEENIINVAV